MSTNLSGRQGRKEPTNLGMIKLILPFLTTVRITVLAKFQGCIAVNLWGGVFFPDSKVNDLVNVITEMC